MKSLSHPIPVLILAGLTTLAAFSAPPSARAAETASREFSVETSEVAALESMRIARRSLNALAERVRGTPQELDILIKLVELNQKISAIEFRVAHRTTNGSEGASVKAPTMAAFQASVHDSIGILNHLIEKYPTHAFIAKALFFRGKCHKDLDELAPAEKDYRTIITQYPSSPMVGPALISLTDVLMDSKRYTDALPLLKQLEARPEKNFSLVALGQLAWAHYYLDDLPSALTYAERKLSYQEKLRLLAGKTVVYDDREAIALATALFYSKALQKNLAGYTVQGAWELFHRPFYGTTKDRVSIRMAYHLRLAGLDALLDQWKDVALAAEPAGGAAIEILIATGENQFNKHRYEPFYGSLKDMGAVFERRRKKGSPVEGQLPAARSFLTTSSIALQKSLTERRGTPSERGYAQILAQTYHTLIHILAPNDPTATKYYFNLAELEFSLKDFSGAEADYRWVVDHTGVSATTLELVAKSSLGAISSRYETLVQKQIIPKDLEPKPLAGSVSRLSNASLSEWLRWLEWHRSQLKSRETTRSELESFQFESNRAIYAAGLRDQAVKRLKATAQDNPTSKFAVPSAALTLDTLIASQDWETVQKTADAFRASGLGAGTEFAAKLAEIGADAAYKQVEGLYAKNKFEAAMNRADDFIKLYPTSQRFNDGVALAASIALGMNLKEKAIEYYEAIPEAKRKPEVRASVALTHGAIAEEAYDFEKASSYFRAAAAVIKLDDKSGPADRGLTIRKKAIQDALISASLPESRAVLADAEVCRTETAEGCDQLHAFQVLWEIRDLTVLDASHRKVLQERMLNAPKENQPVWAVAALHFPAALPLPERNRLLEVLGSSWSGLDASLKFALLPWVSADLPAAFTLARSEIRKKAPVRAQKKFIDRRAELMKDLESSASRIATIPWIRLRASMASELSAIYWDFSRELKALPAPAGLAGADLTEYRGSIQGIADPFEAKGREYSKQAFALGSDSGVEAESMDTISAQAFLADPKFGDEMRAGREEVTPPVLDGALLTRLNPDGPWGDNLVGGRLLAALASRNLWLVSRLLEVSQADAHHPLLAPANVPLVRAVALTTAGARAEGLKELQASLEHLGKAAREETTRVLIQAYYSSYSKAATRQWVESYLKNITSKPDGLALYLIQTAGIWSEASLPEELRNRAPAAEPKDTQ